ncbi:TPA: hypothetical protein ACX6Q7_001397 [Photobacterium damselae]
MKLGLNMSLSFNKIVIPLLSLCLFGCGGSDDGGVTEGNTSPQKVSISAQDALKFTLLNTKTTIDLRQRVQAQNNESLLISDVKSINGDCDILSIDGLSFDIYSRNADVCRFEYSVTPASDKYTGSAKAVAQIVANEEPTQGQYLPPVSRAIQINKSISFNTSDLGIENGYVLDPQSVVVLNGTGTDEIGELGHISESGFDYTAPNTETIVRIFYSVINKAENIVKPGIIYIAIGQNTNISPNAQDRTVESGSLSYNNERTINIEDLVSDADGDELQLVYARGVIGNVDISGNLEFKYKSSTTGHEYITYIVSDHNGGYGIGLLDFTISTYLSISDPAQKLIFFPPLTSSSTELTVTNGVYYEVGSNGYQGFYPTFTRELASSYCTILGGRLPTKAELTTMWKNVLNKPVFQSKFKWHSSLHYLTNIESEQVSLINGQNVSSSNLAYFSCVISTEEPKWEFTQSNVQTQIDTPFSVYEFTHTTNGNIVYRDEKDYKLIAKTLIYNIDGYEADKNQITAKIVGNRITIHQKEAPPPGAVVYLKMELTDEDIPGSQVFITIGLMQCTKDTSPEQALEQACLYTVGVNNTAQRFTLAIPKNLISNAVPDDEHIRIFGQNGTAFIGTTYPNDSKWQNYIRPTCDMMNRLKIDGHEDWAPSASITDNWGIAFTISNEDLSLSQKWVAYMVAADTEAVHPEKYGQGFAGLPGQTGVINQLSNANVFVREPQGAVEPGVSGSYGTYTFASCVTEH